MAFDAKKFGAALRALRESSGTSQAALAERAGLTQAAIAMIEQGKRTVSMEALSSLGEALNVPSECLSILGFRPMSNAKDVADLAQSLQKLIVATVAARTSTQRAVGSRAVASAAKKTTRKTPLGKAAKTRVATW